MTSYLLQYYWPSLLSTGLLAGRRHHWSVTSALPNVMICWFLAPELSLDDGASMLQLQSFGTHFRHGCGLDNSEMGLKPTSYKPTHDSFNFKTVFTYLLTYLLPSMNAAGNVFVTSVHVRVCLSCSCSNF